MDFPVGRLQPIDNTYISRFPGSRREGVGEQGNISNREESGAEDGEKKQATLSLSSFSQNCYGIYAVPAGDWLCWPCREGEAAASAARSWRKALGVWLSTVTPSRARSWRKSAGDRVTRRGTTTSRPP